MAFEKVIYRDWEFEVDKKLTSDLYNKVLKSGAETCNCAHCKYFNSLKPDIYPQEIRDLFDLLGIDMLKEFDVSEFGEPRVEYLFNGWFHFVGKMIKGNSSEEPLPSGGYSIKLTPISKNFEIGFSKNVIKSFFDKESFPLIQIDFNIKIPYTTASEQYLI